MRSGKRTFRHTQLPALLGNELVTETTTLHDTTTLQEATTLQGVLGPAVNSHIQDGTMYTSIVHKRAVVRPKSPRCTLSSRSMLAGSSGPAFAAEIATSSCSRSAKPTRQPDTRGSPSTQRTAVAARGSISFPPQRIKTHVSLAQLSFVPVIFLVVLNVLRCRHTLVLLVCGQHS